MKYAIIPASVRTGPSADLNKAKITVPAIKTASIPSAINLFFIMLLPDLKQLHISLKICENYLLYGRAC